MDNILRLENELSALKGMPGWSGREGAERLEIRGEGGQDNGAICGVRFLIGVDVGGGGGGHQVALAWRCGGHTGVGRMTGMPHQDTQFIASGVQAVDSGGGGHFTRNWLVPLRNCAKEPFSFKVPCWDLFTVQ